LIHHAPRMAQRDRQRAQPDEQSRRGAVRTSYAPRSNATDRVEFIHPSDGRGIRDWRSARHGLISTFSNVELLLHLRDDGHQSFVGGTFVCLAEFGAGKLPIRV